MKSVLAASVAAGEKAAKEIEASQAASTKEAVDHIEVTAREEAIGKAKDTFAKVKKEQLDDTNDQLEAEKEEEKKVLEDMKKSAISTAEKNANAVAAESEKYAQTE